MQDLYGTFFNQNLTHKYNNILFEKDYNCIEIIRIGLHNIYRKKIVKESQFHSHSFCEFHFSLNGYAIYQFADQTTIKLEKGSWVLIPINCPHKIIEYSNKYVKYSCAFKTTEDASQDVDQSLIIHQIFKPQIPLKGDISESVLLLIKQIYSKFSDRHPLSKYYLQALSLGVVFEIASQISIEWERDNSALKNDARLTIASEFIKDNLYNRITGEDVAKKVYLSLRQLDRIFHKNLSVSVSEFMFEQKIEEAKRLLVSTSIPIYEISEKLNFSSSAYFNRFFKKRVGKPPQKFRKDSQKGE